MEIRWSEKASDDFTAIIQYICRENSAAALRIARAIYEQLDSLKKFPNSGRLGAWMELVNSRFHHSRSS